MAQKDWEKEEFLAKSWLKIEEGVLSLKLSSRSVPTHQDFKSQEDRQEDPNNNSKVCVHTIGEEEQRTSNKSWRFNI